MPSASVALTEKVWEPSASLVNDWGEVHAAHAASSSLHSKLAPASELKEKSAEVEVVSAAGWEVMVVFGAVVSTLQLRVAAVPVLPAASVARTWKVWDPSARAV